MEEALTTIKLSHAQSLTGLDDVGCLRSCAAGTHIHMQSQGGTLVNTFSQVIYHNINSSGRILKWPFSAWEYYRDFSELFWVGWGITISANVIVTQMTKIKFFHCETIRSL